MVATSNEIASPTNNPQRFDYYPPLKPAKKISDNARTVLERRYLAKDTQGDVTESVEELILRVAAAVAGPEKATNRTFDFIPLFYEMMADGDFIPNSPTLANAGRPLGQLSACFVLPVEDSIDGIFTAVHAAARIHQTGGGTGYSFSRLRPRGAIVRSTGNQSSGPVEFMKVFDRATEAIKQGGMRRGANMGILRVDHPDIMEFITLKADGSTLQNFNISVAITDAFMEALSAGTTYNLIDPVTNQPSGTLEATQVWRAICENAWKTGDPGLFFIDRVNSGLANPVPEMGPIESTNPCVAGDTLVYTAFGLRRAADLAAMGKDNVVVVNNEPAHFAYASHVFSSGVKPVFRLTTKEGYEIRLTEDHKVRTRHGMVAAKDLREGDHLVLLRHLGGFGLDGNLDIGRLLGWFVGDGGFSGEKATLYFFGAKRELAEDFAKIVNDLVPIGTGKRSVYTVAPQCIEIRDEERISSTRLTGVLSDYGISEANKLIVPDSVLVGTEDMQKGFLQGIFSADGNILLPKPQKGLPTVRLGSVSLELLRDVQRLLLNFGIASRIYKNRRAEQNRLLPDGQGGSKEYRTVAFHEIQISKENVPLFFEEIGFLQSVQQEKYRDYMTDRRGVYRKESYTARFDQLIPDGEEEVFDISVPDVNRFIANGFDISNCGEQSLYPYDACNLGSINLANFVKENQDDYDPPSRIDWQRLGRIVRLAVRFLDNVIDINVYPLPEIEKTVKQIRRIGLGVMGWADLLYLLNVPYDSEEALLLAEQVMGYIQREADKASCDLAHERGVFPAWDKSIYAGNDTNLYRNACRTTVAPTGTISIIAGCSSGIEPNFGLAFERHHRVDPDNPDTMVKMVEVNPIFRSAAEKGGWWSEELEQWVLKGKPLADFSSYEIPLVAKTTFVTAHEIDPQHHVMMQAAFQRHVDNSISKTINLPSTATVETVDFVYNLAYRMGCNGITIYRDGSHQIQVLSHKETVIPQPTLPLSIAPRRRLPDVRMAETHKFVVGEQEGYLTVGMYSDGSPGEVFLRAAKQGSTVSGLIESIGILTTMALQHGVPLETLVEKMAGLRFEPAGRTMTKELPSATSLVDYVFRWMGIRFADQEAKQHHTVGMLCPECGSGLAFTEGCMMCPSCSYSKCG